MDDEGSVEGASSTGGAKNNGNNANNLIEPDRNEPEQAGAGFQPDQLVQPTEMTQPVQPEAGNMVIPDQAAEQSSQSRLHSTEPQAQQSDPQLQQSASQPERVIASTSEATAPSAAVFTQGQVPSSSNRGVVMGGNNSMAAAQPKARRTRSKWLLPVGVGVLVFLIGGGAYGYFGVYLQSPQQVWERALKNTSAGYTRFAQTAPPTSKGVKATGSVKISQPLVVDGNMQFNSDEQNFLLTSDVGMTGIRANLELRGLAAKAGDTPDLYVKVGGLKGIGKLLDPSGTSSIAQSVEALNDKWYGVDHTFIDQALASVKSSGTGASALTNESSQQFSQDLQDINKKVATVLADRLFTTDPKKAIVTVTDNLGKDSFKGRPTEHYRVKVQKAQLHDAVVALKDTLKTTKLNDWLVASDGSSKTFEEATNFDSLLKELDKADYSKATAEVWVDTGLTYVRNVRVFAENAQGQRTGTIDFTLDYTGGDQLPFSVTVNSTEKDNEGTMTFGININQKTYATKVNVAVDALSSGKKVVGSGEVDLVGSNNKVSVQKPAGAGNLMELVAPFISGVSTSGMLPTTPVNLN